MMKPYKSLFLLAVEQLGERKNLLSDLRVLSGLCVDDLALAEPKGDSQSQDANGKGRYDVPPVSGGKTRNFWHKNWPQRVIEHVKHPLPWIQQKNGGWKIPSASYLFLLPQHKKIPVHSEILSHFLRSMPLAFTLAKIPEKPHLAGVIKVNARVARHPAKAVRSVSRDFFPSLLNDKNEPSQKKLQLLMS